MKALEATRRFKNDGHPDWKQSEDSEDSKRKRNLPGSHPRDWRTCLTNLSHREFQNHSRQNKRQTSVWSFTQFGQKPAFNKEVPWSIPSEQVVFLSTKVFM